MIDLTVEEEQAFDQLVGRASFIQIFPIHFGILC